MFKVHAEAIRVQFQNIRTTIKCRKEKREVDRDEIKKWHDLYPLVQKTCVRSRDPRHGAQLRYIYICVCECVYIYIYTHDFGSL